jgi:3-isopropylmalate dehydratase small subunit
MIQAKNRKEITLDTQTLAILQFQAEKQGRKLKNYMEQILKEQANNFELTDEYKAMMDEMLDKHEKGELKYTSWQDAKEELFTK